MTLRRCGSTAHAAQSQSRSPGAEPPMSLVTRFREPRTRWILRGVFALVAISTVGVLATRVWWSYEPDQFDPVAFARERAAMRGQQPVTGSVTSEALAGSIE